MKTLPAERQAAIAEYGLGHTLQETLKWLREDGVETSQTALGNFLSWYSLREQLERNEGVVNQVLEDLRQGDVAMSEEALQKAGHLFFSALAIEQKDSLTWKRTQDAQTRQELARQGRLKLQRDSCELFLKWSEDRRARDIAGSSASNSDKIEQLGELMFGENWK